MTSRRLDPPRAVEVLHGDRWCPGTQDGWIRRDDGVWRASVRYTAGVGEQYDRVVPADQVRAVE